MGMNVYGVNQCLAIRPLKVQSVILNGWKHTVETNVKNPSKATPLKHMMPEICAGSGCSCPDWLDVIGPYEELFLLGNLREPSFSSEQIFHKPLFKFEENLTNVCTPCPDSTFKLSIWIQSYCWTSLSLEYFYRVEVVPWSLWWCGSKGPWAVRPGSRPEPCDPTHLSSEPAHWHPLLSLPAT